MIASTQERREITITDRRTNQVKSAVSCFYKQRRKHHRRDNDTGANLYVDIYGAKEFYIAVLIGLFSALDALFTSMLLSAGSYELNPFMNYLMQKDFNAFLAAKLLITLVCITTLLMHKNHILFNRISGYQCLVGVFAIYSILISYELSMVLKLVLL